LILVGRRMTLKLDAFANPDSPLARLDPRWKLTSLSLAALVAALLHNLPAATLAWAGALALVCAARLPPRWYLARLAALVPFLALFVALLPFLVHDDDAHGTLVPLQVSWTGLKLAMVLSLKALAVVTLMLVLLATAPLAATLKAARALHVPGLLVQLALLAYRYVFVVTAELGRLRVALRVRGYRNRANRHSYRTVGHVAGTLLVRSYERAERVGHAMRCRGFDGRFRTLDEFRTTAADVAFFVLVVGGAAALGLWDLIQR
jgi:cobalt/nickel transport system permease protein